MKKIVKTYTEIKLDNGKGLDKYYVDPKTKTYQYEHALLTAVSDLFKETETSSLLPDRLRLYFNELPIRKEVQAQVKAQKEAMGQNVEENTPCTRRTRDSVMEEMKVLVARDVEGKVTFPMMHQCRAQIRVLPGKDGTHAFLFTDGVYGFSVSLDFGEKKKASKPKKIVVI
ncbi:hypothetical protein D6855_05415 [Butyrivibrio sp. CB08]|uniref:hypothetical protein n=1 Tax=Butyrivibrio sp. CB08 TaxID=2364879 RepID=UPI000EA87846|nr:hypothetical protein [Butyrivibrio sp. CB08]RKM61330.1 hypothetical protein D6855_05415 [Butyrivibrio sp. CB08]